AIERRRSEERQRESDHQVAALEVIEAQLQDAVRTRDEFLSVASHELKTPLTSLNLQIDHLRRLAWTGRLASAPALPEAAKRPPARTWPGSPCTTKASASRRATARASSAASSAPCPRATTAASASGCTSRTRSSRRTAGASWCSPSRATVRRSQCSCHCTAPT